MFSRFVALFPLAALAVVVVATPTKTCDSGSTYCCNQKFSSPSKFEKDPAGLISAVLGLGVNAGVQCSPVSVIGVLSNGAQCTKQTACCENVKQVGLVNVACDPVAVPI